MSGTESTLVLVKPDGVQRGLVGEVVGRFERRGLRLVGLRLMRVGRELAEEHYGEHAGKPFFEALVGYITAGPVVAMVWEGPQAVAVARAVIGATDPAAAAPGTIRGDLALTIGRNLVHGSDAASTAVSEIRLFFGGGELEGWERAVDPWLID